MDFENTEPALAGSYGILLKNGSEVECRPVWQVLQDNVREWTPEKTAKVTWISSEKIRESARMYAGSGAACIEWGVSMSQCSRSTATNQAILHLKAITGNMDIPGGNAFWHIPGYKPSGTPLPVGQEEKRITGGYVFSNPAMSRILFGHCMARVRIPWWVMKNRTDSYWKHSRRWISLSGQILP